ncbi:MAG: DUF4446 family protein [Candidatus Cryosericum sp.]
MRDILTTIGAALESVWGQVGVIAAALGSLVMAVVVLVQNRHQRRRLASFFSEAADPSFYAHIDTLTQAFDQQTATDKELRATCTEIEQTSHSFFDTVDIDHYDAFQGQAGKFSFSLLMLNRNGSGMILTSLTSTTGSKVYVKRIENGKSDTALSREEEELLKKNNRS